MAAKKKSTADAEAPFADTPGVDENAALRAQNDQMLDLLVEMREELDALKAVQQGQPIATPASSEQGKLDAELADLMEEFKDYPQIQVFEQRVLTGIDASVDIRLAGDVPSQADPGGETCHWKLRWFNFGKEGRAVQAGAEGYVKVLWTELGDADMVSTGTRLDEFVRKGQHGTEVLHKIPMKLFLYKKRRDAARIKGLLTSETKLREHVANSVAGLAGRSGDNADQAGSTVHDRFSVTITPGPRETITL